MARNTTLYQCLRSIYPPYGTAARARWRCAEARSRQGACGGALTVARAEEPAVPWTCRAARSLPGCRTVSRRCRPRSNRVRRRPRSTSRAARSSIPPRCRSKPQPHAPSYRSAHPGARPRGSTRRRRHADQLAHPSRRRRQRRRIRGDRRQSSRARAARPGLCYLTYGHRWYSIRRRRIDSKEAARGDPRYGGEAGLLGRPRRAGGPGGEGFAQDRRREFAETIARDPAAPASRGEERLALVHAHAARVGGAGWLRHSSAGFPGRARRARGRLSCRHAHQGAREMRPRS